MKCKSVVNNFAIIISSLFLVIYNFTFVEAKIMLHSFVESVFITLKSKAGVHTKKDDVIIAHWMG